MKHIISENSQVVRKERRVVQEETDHTVAPLEVAWGCLVSSFGTTEFFKAKHVLGSEESSGDGVS